MLPTNYRGYDVVIEKNKDRRRDDFSWYAAKPDCDSEFEGYAETQELCFRMAKSQIDIKLGGLHSQAKKLKGIFTYNAGVYDNPLQAHAEGALNCVNGSTRSANIYQIDAELNCANKALMYASSSFAAVYVVGQLWTADIDGVDFNGDESDLEKHLAEKAIRGTLFIAPHYNMLRPDVWHHLRDILPSMFDLLADNTKANNSKALDIYDQIQDATSALAGFSVPSDRSLALELFVNEWAPVEK